MGIANANRCSHARFFKACEALKANKDRFIDSGMSVSKSANLLSEIAGFAISISTMTDIREATGITWPVKSSANGKKKSGVTTNAIRTLARAVRDLHVKLGEPLPESVQSLLDHYGINHSPKTQENA